MAFYGIQSAGISITGTTADDSIQLLGASTAVVSGDYILGLEGNDLIYLGAEGRTSVASATFSGINEANENASGNMVVTLLQSAGNTTGANVDLAQMSGVATSISTLVSGVVTSQRAARLIEANTINGNAGNDRIYLGAEFTKLSATTLGGGAGDDIIGNYSFINGARTATAGTATTIANSFIEGGGGNDSISFYTNATVTGTTVQGGQGNDEISFTTTANGGTIVNSLIAGGGGADFITGSFDDAAVTDVTVAGGGGNDSIFLEFADDVHNLLVATDTFNTLGTWDGADTLTANFVSAFSGVTIQAGGGNDSISISGDVSIGSNRFDLAAGDDTIDIEEISSDSVFAGGGNDTVQINSSMISGYVALGGGNDTLILSGNAAAAAWANASVIGGAGADELLSGAVSLAASSTINPTLIYSAYSDSTLSAMDTVVAITNAFSGTTKFSFTPGGLSLASFTAAGVSGTNGIATFSGFDNDLTSRVNSIDAAATTVGSTVAFADGDGTTYLFVQGGSTDLLVQNGLSGSGVGAITLSDGTNVNLENA